jgi:predicted transcriptional regulator YdeE
MNYEEVMLEEKKVVGLAKRTNNLAPDMGKVIGDLWSSFFVPDVFGAIQNKSNDKTLGIYTEYAGDTQDDYTILVACEVTKAVEIPEDTIVRTIPAGKYARFVVRGNVQQVVGQFWAELWKLNLPRTFVADFEEYQSDNMEDAEVHVYIGLKG